MDDLRYDLPRSTQVFSLDMGHAEMPGPLESLESRDAPQVGWYVDDR